MDTCSRIMPEERDSKDPTAKTIAELCLKKFNTLPKTGKPRANEWTVMAGVVQHNADGDINKVVALGLGTKCIGRSKLCRNGLILNDSHAEVLARRGFLRYIFTQLKCVAEGGCSIFQWNYVDHMFNLRDNVRFHFMSTQTPCGDACIVEDVGTTKFEAEDQQLPLKRLKLAIVQNKSSDFTAAVFTGAKLIIGHEATNSPEADCLEQRVGAVRTKPGRGERTLSMSCSDKLARWNVMGVQGALLDVLLLQPIYFKTFTFCAEESSREAIERAIYGRWLKAMQDFVSKRYAMQRPVIDFCALPTDFVYAQSASKQPAPNGLVWCDVAESLKPLEICVDGKRQGVTSKKLSSPQAALRLSKFYMLQDFITVLESHSSLRQSFDLNEEELPLLTYAKAKRLASAYQAAWSDVKTNIFGQWTQKPQDLLDFSIESVGVTWDLSKPRV